MDQNIDYHSYILMVSIACLAITIVGNIALMVLILDGSSGLVALIRRNLCYLICLRHLERSRAGTNRIFFLLRKDLFFFMGAQYVLSYLMLAP